MGSHPRTPNHQSEPAINSWEADAGMVVKFEATGPPKHGQFRFLFGDKPMGVGGQVIAIGSRVFMLLEVFMGVGQGLRAALGGSFLEHLARVWPHGANVKTG